MKTPEEALEQWVSDRVHFYGGFNSRGKEFWTRDELELLASQLRKSDDVELDLSLGTPSKLPAILEAFPAEHLVVIRQHLVVIRQGRKDGPKITAQYLASFDSIEELIQHFRAKGWIPP